MNPTESPTSSDTPSTTHRSWFSSRRTRRPWIRTRRTSRAAAARPADDVLDEERDEKLRGAAREATRDDAVAVEPLESLERRAREPTRSPAAALASASHITTSALHTAARRPRRGTGLSEASPPTDATRAPRRRRYRAPRVASSPSPLPTHLSSSRHRTFGRRGVTLRRASAKFLVESPASNSATLPNAPRARTRASPPDIRARGDPPPVRSPPCTSRRAPHRGRRTRRTRR